MCEMKRNGTICEVLTKSGGRLAQLILLIVVVLQTDYIATAAVGKPNGVITCQCNALHYTLHKMYIIAFRLAP